MHDIDDILIYSETGGNENQVMKVLIKLREAGLFVKPEMCKISIKKQKTKLGFVISAEGIEMDDVKVKAILKWEALKSV